MLPAMTHKQVDTIVKDLEDCMAQLRSMRRQGTPSYHICNALGRGVFGWRIPDSQREELRCRDEAAFNAHLINDMPL